jgi:hypothetical protein
MPYVSVTVAERGGESMPAEVDLVRDHAPACVLRLGIDCTIHFRSPDSMIDWAHRAIDGAERLKAMLAARMRDPAHVPTLAEALHDPAGFVAGMTETSGVHDALPDHIQRRVTGVAGLDRIDSGE